MNDRLEFDISGVNSSIESMKTANQGNESNKQAFLDYIDGTLAHEWNTQHGREAVQELRNFANGTYQDYINYINGKISNLENNVVPSLNTINRA